MLYLSIHWRTARFLAQVVLPVIVNNSYSEAFADCAANFKCMHEHHVQNELFLNRVKELVELELHVLGVPTRLFSSVIILPMCRLGSHARGSERGSPCASSFWSGQYIATYFGYTLVGAYFKVRTQYFLYQLVDQMLSRVLRTSLAPLT
jgi:hypothetical protein